MYERMLYTPMETHLSSSIYTPLFSGHKSNCHRDPSQDRVVCEEEQKWVIVTLDGDFPQTISPTNPPLKRYPGPHQHHKLIKIY